MNTIKYLSASLLSLSLIACGGGGGGSNEPTPVHPPAAPASFNVTAGNASANVSWTQVSGTTYTLYRATAANISPSNCSTTPSCVKIDNADPRTITGLTNGTPYYFVATASKDGQTSDPTATRMVTPVAPAVAAPSGFVATAGNGGVSLNWDVLPSTTYTVYYATSNTLTPANCATLAGCVTRANATPGQIAGLTNNTAYYFILTATQSGTTSPASTRVTATPIPAAVPAPTGVAATAGNAQATVSWNSVAGNTYNLYRATSASLTPANCATLAGCVKTTGVTTPRIVTSLTNDTTYYFVVTANNSGIESPASSVVNAKPAAPLVVNAPTGVAAAAGNAQATVSWTQLASTTYNLYLSESATVSPSNYSSQAGGRMIAGVTSPYTVPTLTNGKTYYFVLTATQQTTTSAPSTAVSAMPVAAMAYRWARVDATRSFGAAAASALGVSIQTDMINDIAVAYGANRFVAAISYNSATVGDKLAILESTDARTWRAVTLPISADAGGVYKNISIMDLKFVNSGFVLTVNKDGVDPNLFILKSSDGINWSNVNYGLTVEPCGTTSNDTCYIYANSSALVFHSEEYSSSSDMFAKPDFTGWSNAGSWPSNSFQQILSVGAQFVNYGAYFGSIELSPDGAVWTQKAVTVNGAVGNVRAEAAVLIGNQIVVFDNSDSSKRRCVSSSTSPEILTCTANSRGFSFYNNAYANSSALLLAQTTSGVLYSLDQGVSWSLTDTSVSGYVSVHPLFYAAGKWYAVNLNAAFGDGDAELFVLN